MFDCIIVGAGPAGSSTAYHLAQKGCSVLVLDKSSFPRYKSCTGALSPLVAQWFDFDFDFDPAIDRKLRRIRYTWKLGDEIASELQTQDPIWIVKRDWFDAFMVQQAIAQGITFQDNTTVTGVDFSNSHWTVRTPQETFQSHYLVAADGAEGPLAEWLGFSTPKLRQGAVFQIPTELPGEDAALNFEFGLLKNGCLWCFPQSQGYIMGGITFLGRNQPDYNSIFATYANSFGADSQLGQIYRHPLKLWDGNRALHTQQAVLVGEAGAIVDPLSAEGLRPGMYSGMKAAEAIHAALQGEADALASYTAAMHEWGNNIQWAQRIASVFFRVPGIGYRVGIKRPTMTTRMGQLLAGEIQYSDIANRVLKRLSTGFLPGRS
ncbi:geranylgeranyl reductase family protein [Oscillatoria sp. CS-180]|uniref:geranylgeranyl reductase family protein n=1 Tax=Oscillatoria sp. CS-180 TaxID=3021720 RepID=UPI00232F0963|nr:geranylgeranyl reductase family protein [Oscillatoria sp. CS-180]MDB9527730.1 geranylgeranyl reductase family protein [Oscillatoria sp. CS-180]